MLRIESRPRMNVFSRKRHGLSPFIKSARKRGFVALAIDGGDIVAAIAEEQSEKILARAVDVAQRHEERIWAERCAHRLHEVSPNSHNKLSLASIRVRENGVDGIGDLLAEVEPHHKDQPLYRETMAVLRAKQGRIDEAFALFDTLPGGLEGIHPAPIVLPTAIEMLSQSDFRYAAAMVRELRERYPDHLYVRSLSVKCHIYEGNIERARELAHVSSEAMAEATQYDRRELVEANAAILSHLGWLHEQFEFVRDALTEDPTHWSLYSIAAETAKFSRRDEEYAALVADIPSAHAETPEAMLIRCQWHVDKNRVDQAEKLLKRLRRLSTPLFLNAQFFLSVNHRTPEDVEKAYDACIACGIPALGSIIGHALYLYYYHSSTENIRRALTLLESRKNSAATNTLYWQTYLRLLIASEQDEDAADCYANLPLGLQNSSRLRPFALYFKAMQGKHESAKGGWTAHIRESRHLCVNARSSYPETVRLRYSETPGAVLLFAVVFNGSDYIDWFLEHYRTLGVDHFFITDNGSTDGTAEKLLREPDVSVFFNSGSFAGSGFGVHWTNHLLQRFGVNHWCFHMDIDEGFVFPGQDQGRSLKDLLSYFDKRGFSSVRSFELDMYPETFDGGAAADPFVASCYFDSEYFTMRSEIPPYEIIQGGVRQRMTGLAMMMHKSPLVRMAPDVRYIECNHNTTHLPVADVSTAILHYKFIGDMKRKIDEAISKDEHHAGAKIYRRLKDAANAHGWAKSLLSPHSRRYERPSDLVKFGLMHSSPSWDAFKPKK